MAGQLALAAGQHVDPEAASPLDHVQGACVALDRHGADRRIAVLTSAVRDAANGREFAGQVEQRYGLTAHVLSGDQEAGLTFLGATSERDPEDRTPAVVIDIGGGSTEIVIGSGHQPTFHVSTRCRVVRQNERHLHSAPPTAAEPTRMSSR